jgi:hypothetical protein
MARLKRAGTEGTRPIILLNRNSPEEAVRPHGIPPLVAVIASDRRERGNLLDDG